MKKIRNILLIILGVMGLASCGNQVVKQTETDINVRKGDVSEGEKKEINLSKKTHFGGGSTRGNYGYLSEYGIEYYRTYTGASKEFTELVKTPTFVSGEMNSSFYNTTPYKGIYEFSFSYKSSLGFKILYSSDRSYSNEVTLNATDDFLDVTVKTDSASFFKFESLGDQVYFNSVDIKYNNIDEPKSTDFLSYDDYRLNVEYTEFDNIKDGEVRRMPTGISVSDDGSYKITGYKDYTYHTLDYLLSNTNEANNIAITDPVDVANYYMLFHTFPLNYGDLSTLPDLERVFEYNKLRKISTYSRTDGYAKSVPYAIAENSTVPVYYELDFDESGFYTTSNRGTGRIVIWEAGFDVDDYQNQPVIVYTDDHYATFKEYLNYGSFGTRFNAERKVTGLTWTKPTTLK